MVRYDNGGNIRTCKTFIKPEYVDWNTFDEFEYPNREGYVRAKDVDARIDDLMKNKKC